MGRDNPARVTVAPELYIHFAVLLFLLPLPWIAGWIAAMVFHELGHYLALRLLGGRPERVELGFGVFCMQGSPMAEWKNVAAIVCGPLSGFLLALFGRWIPKTAVCGWLLSCYNLLPVLPLDGGRILRIVLKNRPCFWQIQKGMLFLLLTAAVIDFIFWGTGLIPVLFVAGMGLRVRNIACKEQHYRVQ